MFHNTMLLIKRPVMRRFFLRTLASYLAIVLLSTLAFIPVVWYVRGMVQNVRIQAEYDDSAAAMENLTSQLRTIQNTFLYLSTQKGFDRVSLIRGDIEPRDYIAMNNARAFLSSIQGANSLIEDIIVAFDKNDIVLTSQCVFDSRASFAGFYSIDGLTDALSGFAGRRSTTRLFRFLPQTTLMVPGMIRERSVIPFCLPLSTMLNPVTTYGSVIVLLNSEQVSGLLLSPSVLESGLYEIADAAGDSLAGVSFLGEPIVEGHVQRVVEGTEYTCFQVPGELLNVSVGISTASFFAYANPVLGIMLRYILIGMLAGLLFSLHSAARASRPVRRILAQLNMAGSAPDHDNNAYQLILRSIDDMLEKNSRLSAISQAVSDERLGRQLDHLITGCGGEGIRDERIPARSALCYAQHTDGDGNAALDRSLSILLPDYIKRLLPPDWILHPLTSEGFLILAPCEGEAARKSFAAFLSKTFDGAGRLLGAELRGAVGPLCLRTDEISHAFESAKLLYYTQKNQRGGPVWMAPEGNEANMALTIPGQTELYHLLLSGKYEEADARIRTAFTASGGENTGMEQIFYTIRLVMIMAMSQLNLSFHLRRYHPNVPPEENIETLLSAARRLCDMTNTGKRSHNEQLLDNILACIEARFSDCDLCNAIIAEDVGISEKYLCSFVREQTGRTIGDLLQSKRVAYAHGLLADSEKPINDIWRLSGFGSHNTFYKTIRRVYGLSPSELRASR